MRRVVKIVGITDPNLVRYAVLWLFYGKVLTTGILDAFCQALLLGSNIDSNNDSSIQAHFLI